MEYLNCFFNLYNCPLCISEHLHGVLDTTGVPGIISGIEYGVDYGMELVVWNKIVAEPVWSYQMSTHKIKINVLE